MFFSHLTLADGSYATKYKLGETFIYVGRINAQFHYTLRWRFFELKGFDEYGKPMFCEVGSVTGKQIHLAWPNLKHVSRQHLPVQQQGKLAALEVANAS